MSMRRFKLVALFKVVALSGLVLLPVGASSPAAAQSSAAYIPTVARGQDFELSVRNIMRGPELLGQAPAQIRWTDDSEWLYFRWRPGGLD